MAVRTKSIVPEQNQAQKNTPANGSSFRLTPAPTGFGPAGTPLAKPGVSLAPQTAKVAAPAPSNPFAPGGGGLPVGGGGGGASAAAAPAQSDEDYLGGDSQYQLQLAALMKALSDEQADTGAQQTKYNTDYSDSVKNLGWMQDDPTTQQDEGAWNFQDANTAAGRAFGNQQNDYAGRGLLQSSAYATANDNLTRSLNDQLSSTNKAKQSFLDDLARQQGTFASDNQNQVQQAKIDALARRASGVSLVQ